jgi:hypothetical protein
MATSVQTNDGEAGGIDKKQFEFIFYYGSHAIQKLVMNTFQVDIKTVCPMISEEIPYIKKQNKKLYLDIVDRTHKHGASPELFQDITFLLNAAKVVFDVIKAGLEKDGQKFMADYEIDMDQNHNIFIDGHGEYRIGVVVEDVIFEELDE